jgi:hypothetical protein
VHFGDVVRYIVRDAGDEYVARRWHCVFNEMRFPGPLQEVFETPLMVSLARAIYNPRYGENLNVVPDPEELCAAGGLTSRQEIEQHLFDGFVESAYRATSARGDAGRPSWRANRAVHWLRVLARHLEENEGGTPDIRWWNLYRAGPQLGLAALAGLVVATALFVLLIPAFMLAAGTVRTSIGPIAALSLLEGGCAAIAVSIRSARRPAQGLRWSTERQARAIALGGAIGLQGAGFAAAVMFQLSRSLPAAAVFGGLGVLGGFLTTVVLGLETTPADLSNTATPGDSTVLDRAAFRILTLVAGAALGIFLGVALGLIMGRATEVGLPRLVHVDSPDLVRIEAGIIQPTIDAATATYWAYVGVVAGLGGGIVAGLARSAWSTYVLARWYLAGTGRTPWRLMGFLRDAHLNRGVLRQAGPVYQFRHLELQRRLANVERSKHRIDN